MSKDRGQVAVVPPKRTIQVCAGEPDTIATAVEAAIKASGLPVYQRGLALVQPVGLEVPTSQGRMTIAASLREMTSTAMLDIMAQCVAFTRFDRRRACDTPHDPPRQIADIILSRAGHWTFPVVAGVIAVPTLRPDGTILSEPGYDPATRLYLMPSPDLIFPEVPTAPTQDEAQAALGVIDSLLGEFPFATPVDRSVALSGLITPVVRGAMQAAPLHAIRASTAGSGKSYLVDVVSSIATGRPCPVMAVSRKEEETDSRLVGLLRAGYPIVSLDNVTEPLGGNLLCQAIERPVIRLRPLGKSDIIEIENCVTLFTTGNNLRVVGDMTRRTLVCTLDANVERPELREFAGHPVRRVQADRGRFVAACLIIVRAYLVAGSPARLKPIASFEGWSDLVRSALVWLGCADPVSSMVAAREDDPELMQLREVMSLWRENFGFDVSLTCQAVYERAAAPTLAECEAGGASTRSPLHSALLQIGGKLEVNHTKRLGQWLRANENRIVDGLCFRRDGQAHGGVWRWRVACTEQPVDA